MGQALYRKYRSRSLDELVGQEHITQTLARALKAGRISHAYLFTGPRGTGKTSVARILAHEINQLPYSDAPNLDIIEIDAASNRRIDDIRDLREKVFITPVNAKYKVYIIDEVHMLTGESFNALLKTLEEPPAHVVFILATTEVQKLPATIVSRTQRFSFRPGTKEKVAGHLRNIANKESIAIDDPALELIAEHSEGGFRDSLSLLDQLAHSSESQITADTVADMLGLAPKTQIESIITAYTAHDTASLLAALQTLQANGTSASVVVAQLIRGLVAAAPDHPELYQLMDKLLDVPRAYNPDLKLLTVLLGGHQTVVAPKSVPAIATPAAVTVASAPAKPTPAAKQAEPTPTQEEPAPLPQTPLNDMTNAQWHQVLAAVKKASPPLFSVVKQAEPQFDATNNVLLLTFKYALHRKKLDDPKSKLALVTIMAATLGGTPEVKTDVNPNATPPPPPPADPALANVAAIMGGGEVIDAQDA